MTIPTWQSAARAARRILVAVSGGADSVLLHHRLLDFSRTEGLELCVAHINHQTRGAESEADHRFVSQLALEAGLPFFERRLAGTRDGAHRNEWELREGRLRLLREMAREAQCPAVALGHHRDDLAETFLLMALRGSGPGGLGSMKEVARWPGGPVAIRPLLNLSRGEIRAELSRRGIPWREDSSNVSHMYRRNLLRERVIPLLEEMEPGALRLLARSARLCAGEHDVYSEACGEALEAAREAQGRKAVLLRLDALAPLGPALCAGVLRQASTMVVETAGQPPITPRHPQGARLDDAVERILAGNGAPARFDLENGTHLWVGSGLALVYQGGLAPEDAFGEVRRGLGFALLDDGGEWALPVSEGASVNAGGWRFAIRLGGALPVPESPWEATFPRDVLGEALRILPVGAGDPIVLAGGGRKSAGASLKDAGVPHLLRDRVAGVYSGDRLLWIPGVRQAADTLLAGEETEGGRIRVEFV